MGLIRYSCGHILGHHEPIHVKFGVWRFFIMLYRNKVMKMLKCKQKILMTSQFGTLLANLHLFFKLLHRRIDVYELLFQAEYFLSNICEVSGDEKEEEQTIWYCTTPSKLVVYKAMGAERAVNCTIAQSCSFVPFSAVRMMSQ